MIGAVPPPPGVRSNFIDPPSRAQSNLIALTICVSLTTLFVIMRIYTRLFISRLVRLDDYVCILAYMLSMIMSSLFVAPQTYGLGRHLWDVPASTFNKLLNLMFVGEMVYLVVAAVTRLTLILFFERIFFPNPRLKVFTRIGIFSCLIFFTAILFRSIFQCSPLQKVWSPLLPGNCLSQAVASYTTGVFNIISDLYILILPMPCIWRLKLETGRKLRIMAIFSVGLFACVASIVRLVITVRTVNDSDVTWSRIPLILWTILEVDVGIICACILALPAFIEHHCPQFLKNYASRLLSYCSNYFSSGSKNRRFAPGPHPSPERPGHHGDAEELVKQRGGTIRQSVEMDVRYESDRRSLELGELSQSESRQKGW